MPQPRFRLRFFYILLLIFCPLILAQSSIIFDVIDAGGNENFNLTSPRFKMSSVVGQPTPISPNALTGSSYSIYPGFRKIDRDLWYPFSWFNISIHYASGTSFVLSWSGIDTTSHDGEGWGIWNYDLQYKIGAGGVWTDWRMATVDTFATFGPASPVAVAMGQAYYFRLRARDRVRNVSPWGDQDSMIVNYAVEFCIVTPPPGLPTGPFNFATIQYYPAAGSPTSVNIWQGECLELWCVPNQNATISRTSSASTATQRWAVSSAEDTTFLIDGSPDSYEIEFWHQIKPYVYLNGTDLSHTISTLQHGRFGYPHLESGIFGNWNDWADYGSTLEFSEFTTGAPARRAEAEDSIRFHNITAFFNDTIHYSAFGYLITVQTNFGDSVNVDGIKYPSPYYTNWFEGSAHTIACRRQVEISPCNRWVFQRWSDGSTDTFRTVTVFRDTVFTAIFEHQYRVDISNPSMLGSPSPATGSHWYTAGDTAIGWMDTYGVFAYILVGYLGTGSALSGGGPNFWFEVYDCSTIEWVWVPNTGDLCTLRVYSRYGHPHPTGVYVVPRGTSVWCSVEDSTFEGGAWHYNTGFLGDGTVAPASGTDNIINFTMTGNGWLVWQWDGLLEMPLVISSSPSVHGPPVPPVGTHWYELGASINAFVVNNPDAGWWCLGYESHGALPSSSADSVHFTLSAPTEIDWQWLYYPSGPLDTIWVFSRFGEPLPARGMHRYPHGTHITAVVTPFDGVHFCHGWSGTGSTPPTGTGTSVSFTLSSFSTLTWNWDGEDLIPFVVQNPGGYDSPNPPVGVHWYAPMTVINASVTSPSAGWYCIGYNGFGSVPIFGYPAYCNFMITMASGIEWLWSNDVVALRVTAPTYTFPIPPAGITYHPRGRFIPASNVDTVWVHAGFRHSCVGWTGDGIVVPATGSTNYVNFVMTASGQLTWNYKDQYYISLDHIGLPVGVDPVVLRNEGWFNVGDTAFLETDSVVMVGDDPYVFLQWQDSSLGAPIHDAGDFSTYMVVDSCYNLIAEFREAVWVEIRKNPAADSIGWIRINSDTTFGAKFAGYLVRGFEYIIQVSRWDWSYEVKYDFLNWPVDLSTSDTRVLIPESDTILYADYQRFWHIIVEKRPAEDTWGRLIVDTDTYVGIESIRRDFWWADGSLHRIEHTASDSSPTIRYDFYQWNDGLTSRIRNYGPVSRSDSLVALYQKKALCRVAKSPLEPWGKIEINGVVHTGVSAVNFWHNWGNSLTLAVSRYDVHDDSVYTFHHWERPGSPTDSSIAFLEVFGPDTFKAIYTPDKIHIIIEIGHRGVFPKDSIWWLIPDSLDFTEERIMPRSDSIRIVSNSNVPVQLGLQVDRVYDISSGMEIDPYWAPAYTPGINKFSLYGQFTTISTPPVTWSRINDYVKDSPLWATTTKFGPGGNYIPPAGVAGNWSMLWFKFSAPIASTNADHQRCIKVKLLAKIYLP